MLLMTVAQAASERAGNVGTSLVPMRNPGGFDVALCLQIVGQVIVDSALRISVFRTERLEIHGGAVRTYLCRHYPATDVTNRMRYT